MKNPEIAALLTLLVDDDRAVLRAVRERLLAIGEDALDELRTAEKSDDPRLRIRVRELRIKLERRAIFRRLMELAECENPDLEAGTLLLASTHTPDLDHASVSKKLDLLARQLQPAVEAAATPAERLMAFLNGIHTELGFAGAQSDFYNYDNNFLHTVIERKRGIPISLILIYILIGRRLGMDFRAVGAPQRALAWYVEGGYSTYIDAFEGGRLMNREETIAFLRRQSIIASNYDQLLTLLSDRGILERMAQNLIRHTESVGLRDYNELFKRLARALFDYRNRDRAALVRRDQESE